MGITYIYKVVYKNGELLEHYNLKTLTAYMNKVNTLYEIPHFLTIGAVKNIALNRNKPTYIDCI